MNRLERILAHLQRHELWGFALKFVRGDNDHWDKVPLVRWKHLQCAPPSPAEVAAWCREWPDASAAIPTGPATRIMIIDADDAGGCEWLELRGMPETVMLRTPRLLHYYLEYPSGIDVHNTAGAIAPGVDVRGIGGMAVAAGSQRPDGAVYRYDQGHALGEIPIAPAPDWLLDWLIVQDAKKQAVVQPVEARPFEGRISAYARKIIDDELARLAAAVNGTRNQTLTEVAFKLGQLAAGGQADEYDLQQQLRDICIQWRDEHAKSIDTLSRAFAEGMHHPRRRPLRDVRWVEVRR